MAIMDIIISVVTHGVAVAIGYTAASRLMERRDKQMAELRRPRSEHQARELVETAGPQPSDIAMGPFLGDEIAEEEFSRRLDEDIEKEWEAGRKEYFKPLLTATKDEDANEALYIIAVVGPNRFISLRNIAERKKWGNRRSKMAVSYLIRNRYIKVEENSRNRGSRYTIRKDILTDKVAGK